MHHALENRVAIIVGSSSGMGKATARSYAQAGASVVLAARSKDKLDWLHRVLITEGAGISFAMNGADNPWIE